MALRGAGLVSAVLLLQPASVLIRPVVGLGAVGLSVGVPVVGVVEAVVVVDGGLLLDDLAARARAGHGGAKEDVDQEHDGEEDAEGDAQPHQPRVAARGSETAGAVIGGNYQKTQTLVQNTTYPTSVLKGS